MGTSRNERGKTKGEPNGPDAHRANASCTRHRHKLGDVEGTSGTIREDVARAVLAEPRKLPGGRTLIAVGWIQRGTPPPSH